MTENQVAKALHDGLDTLRRRGWTQWELCDLDGRVCARGALADVTEPDTCWFQIEETLQPALLQADRLLCDVAAEQYPERTTWHWDAIAHFNNANDTTQEDVERVFEKAIVKAYETVTP